MVVQRHLIPNVSLYYVFRQHCFSYLHGKHSQIEDLGKTSLIQKQLDLKSLKYCNYVCNDNWNVSECVVLVPVNSCCKMLSFIKIHYANTKNLS